VRAAARVSPEMSLVRRLQILVNPTAGVGGTPGRRRAAALNAKLEAIRHKLTAAGLEVRICATESGGHATELARSAAQAGEEVVAFGGDGMARLAATGIRGTDTVLGVLPGGRGNDFAAVLGVPRDPVAACEVLISGSVRQIDVGEVNGQLFLGNASIGLESEVTPVANAAPRVGGRAVYLGATLYGLARWRPARFELEIDGRPCAYVGYMAATANTGRFGGGMRVAPGALLDDGLLEVIVIGESSRLKFIRGTPKVFRGTHIHEPNVHTWQAREVRLDADRPFAVYADGDELARTPAEVTIAPKALRVRAP
jgi:YegS/Rv2252/BmrU family lipid kinase